MAQFLRRGGNLSQSPLPVLRERLNNDSCKCFPGVRISSAKLLSSDSLEVTFGIGTGQQLYRKAYSQDDVLMLGPAPTLLA